MSSTLPLVDCRADRLYYIRNDRETFCRRDLATKKEACVVLAAQVIAIRRAGNRKVLWKSGTVAQPLKSEYEPVLQSNKYLA